jgi:predicted ribosomally synthesized peptide with SipW-like signal peptide
MNKKRILLSLIVLGTAASAIILGTSAFFSDTETSSGNTFTAGALDLKADSLLITMVMNVSILWQSCISGETNLVQNGNFETPTVVDSNHWNAFLMEPRFGMA